jgi:hypothetical protein
VKSGSLFPFSEELATRHESEPDKNNKDNKNDEFSNTLFISRFMIYENFLNAISGMLIQGVPGGM